MKARNWLRVAFLLGAIVDGVVAFLMFIPPLAKLFWGFSHFTREYRFALGIGGSLMLGWTLLLPG